MYFSHRKRSGVSERIWSVNLDESSSGEYQTLGGDSSRPRESLGVPAKSLRAQTPRLGVPGSAGSVSNGSG
jgi:hypothetical protein